MSDAVFVHPSAIVDTPCEIGAGTKIWHFSHVMKGARIGRDCVLGQNVYVGSAAVLGNGVKVQNNVSLYDDVILEEGVFCGPSAVFTNVLTPRAFVERKTEYQRTLVRRGASIGANATVVCGTTLGEYCLVAAGAVVTRDVAPYALVKGAPARRTGWVCRCGEKLPNAAQVVCQRCGLQYQIDADRCTPDPVTHAAR
jgi:UDP-2-acetamido-3-amino-2,3-dideoxy-glucuronate N-acetyltransferase